MTSTLAPNPAAEAEPEIITELEISQAEARQILAQRQERARIAAMPIPPYVCSAIEIPAGPLVISHKALLDEDGSDLHYAAFQAEVDGQPVVMADCGAIGAQGPRVVSICPQIDDFDMNEMSAGQAYCMSVVLLLAAREKDPEIERKMPVTQLPCHYERID